jgi:hypothetical protein
MKRRGFLSVMGVILPTAFLSVDVLFSSCNPDVEKEEFTKGNIQLLDEIGETIIPATSGSPGAKAAKIGEFMKVYVTDCYTPEQQHIFWTGITKLKDMTKKKYHKEFSQLTLAQKQAVLKTFETESVNTPNQKQANGDAIQTGKGVENKEAANTAQFFPMIQHLTVFGYFTSKPGATEALRYIQTPGSYEGDVPYKKGEKAWAT